MLLCFPIGCLKGWILIGSALTVLIALGMVVGTPISDYSLYYSRSATQ
jgi:hypothetical protein